MNYDAILFDFDGVLMDSEPVHYACWSEALRRYLLMEYRIQIGLERAKWLVGSKRALRAQRIGVYKQVLASGLQPRQHPRQVLQVDADAHGATHAVLPHSCQNLRQAGVEIRKIEMAVRIDQHGITGKG